MAKKILLINSRTPDSFKFGNRYLPLGLMYLASALIKSGYNVELKDIQNETLNMTDGEIEDYLDTNFKEYLKKVNPDFVGIGILFSLRFKSALRIAKIVKEVLNGVPILFGGAHATLFPKAILEEYSLYTDYIVMGEGDHTIVKLLNAHFNNGRLLDAIDGIAYKDNGRIAVNPKKDYIKDLDDLAFPNYEILNIEDYYFDTSEWHNPKKIPFKYNFPVITSRGCPSRCTYCALRLYHGSRYRTRSSKNVVDEIQYLYDKYDCRYISFIDDTFTLEKKRTLEIMSEIRKRKLHIQFDTSNGIEIRTVDEDLLEAMVEAGLCRVTVGIETGSEHLRIVILKKNLKNETIYNFFKMAKKYKHLRFAAFFMCGFPQETRETLDSTFEMIKSLPLDNLAVSILTPFYGTEMFQYCYENGLLDVDLKNLHNISDFSYRDSSFLKPLNLDPSYIIDFREKVLRYIKEKNFAEIENN